MINDPRTFFLENCYALRGCLHCPDCLAFALKFYRLAQLPADQRPDDELKRKRNLVLKFMLATIAAENLPCEYAITSENLRNYINELLNEEAKLPNCHHEFR